MMINAFPIQLDIITLVWSRDLIRNSVRSQRVDSIKNDLVILSVSAKNTRTVLIIDYLDKLTSRHHLVLTINFMP